MICIRQEIEYQLFRVGNAIIPPLSRRKVVMLANSFGTMTYYVCRHLRNVGLANLELAYGSSKTKAEQKAILKQAFRTFCLVVLDIFWFSRDIKTRMAQHVSYHESCDCLKGNTGSIALTVHIGNWELLGRYVSVKTEPLTSVAAPLSNPKVDAGFNAMRSVNGEKIIQKHGAFRKLLRTLRSGNNIAMLLDQNTKPSDGGIFVDFFKLPVPISISAAELHLRANAPIFLGCMIPDELGNYQLTPVIEVKVDEIENLPKRNAIKKITQAIATAMENNIRSHPGSWLWMYKRWKHVAPDHTLKEYPFYAKELLEKDRIAAMETGEKE